MLAEDPNPETLTGRAPVSGERWASQSMLPDFENGVGRVEIYRMVEALAGIVIDRHRKRLGRKARTIILDFDPTDDPSHGQQDFSFDRGHDRTLCFLPRKGRFLLGETPVVGNVEIGGVENAA